MKCTVTPHEKRAARGIQLMPPLRSATLSLLILGCGAKINEHNEGETHFLRSCSEAQPCDGGYTCLCGVCTSTCEEPAACQALNSTAICATALDTQYRDTCSPQDTQLQICVQVHDLNASQVENQTDSGTFPEQDCLPPDVSSTLLNATPRENLEAETLAVMASGELIASDADYERAVRDHAALVELDPRFDTFWTSSASPRVGAGLVVVVTKSTQPDFVEASSCINAAYGATVGYGGLSDWAYAHVNFDGVFNLDVAAATYEALPMVTSVSRDVLTPPAVVIADEVFMRSVKREQDTWTYSATITMVDCSIELSVTTDVDGNAEVVRWDSDPQELPAATKCQRPAGI